MATTKEQEEVQKTIWAIAEKLRNKVDGWDFKAYVLGMILYRYISENITEYINYIQEQAGVSDFNYADMDDEEAKIAKDQIVQEKGFFILPSQLFCNVAKNAADVNLNEKLSNAFKYIESSAIGKPSEEKVSGLFSDFIIDNTKIGATVSSRNKIFASVVEKVAEMNLKQDIKDHDNDTFGDAYEYLMSMYAASSGKSGGEFFTPQEVSEVLAEIASHDNNNISSVYDPACGSGSLLLKFSKIVGKKNPELKYYGQEVNPTTYNLCRANMFLHNINFDKFDIQLEDTLINPQHLGMEFDAIVSNPPYSLKWEGKENTILINDARYSPAGVLAPKSAADLAFTMHMLYHLKESGTCAIVEFPGVLYRGGAEKSIREYLLKNNFVDTVIQLPANLFFGVGIATCIIVLRKGRRPDNQVLFIDASAEFSKKGNKNVLLTEHQERIVNAYKNRKDEQYFCKLVSNEDILANDCNLSVSSYVEAEDTREKIDIEAVNKDIVKVVNDVNKLREMVNGFIEEMEG